MNNYIEYYDLAPGAVAMALVEYGTKLQRCVLRYPREYLPFRGTPEQVADALTKVRNNFSEYNRGTGWQLWYDVKLSKSHPANCFYVAIWWEQRDSAEPEVHGPLMDVGPDFLRIISALLAAHTFYIHELIEHEDAHFFRAMQLTSPE